MGRSGGEKKKLVPVYYPFKTVQNVEVSQHNASVKQKNLILINIQHYV